MLLIIAGLAFSLRYEPVQTYVAKKAANYLSRQLGTEVSLSGLYLDPFASFVLRDLYVQDRTGDTLLYAQELKAAINLARLHQRRATIGSLRISEGLLALKRYTDSTNTSFLAQYFQKTPTESESPKSSRWHLDLGDVNLADMRFSFRDFRGQTTERPRAINYQDMEITELNGTFSDIDFSNHWFKSAVTNLSLREKSGFRIREMNAAMVIDADHMEFQELYLETNRSRLRDYLKLHYGHFSQFVHFVDSVDITLGLNDAYIDSRDIEFFAPDMVNTRFVANMSGELLGRVNAIRGRDIVLRTGERTRLRGDIQIDGLPDINQTLFSLRLDELATTSDEIEVLVPQLARQTHVKLPDIFDRMGDVVYQGSIIGLYNDFIADGALQTQLGLLDADINLTLINKGIYAGNISSPAFQLGQLLDYSAFGQATFDLRIAGEGFVFQEMDTEMEGTLAHLDYNGYRYENITLEGNFHEMLFAGRAHVSDPNLALNFDGSVNFNPNLPEYSFVATIEKANLHRTGIYTNDSVNIQHAVLTSDFSGDALNNMQGHVRLDSLRFTHQSDSFSMHSLTLVAEGNENQRTVKVESDLFDGALNGISDWSTFGAYFRSVAMRYAPSMDLDNRASGSQEFDVELHIKDFAPIAPFVDPKLAIHDGLTFSGYFSTRDSLANFNLVAPSIQYGNIHLQDVLVDESANRDTLLLLASIDRISLSDSIYVENTHVSNKLANDVLYFAVASGRDTATNGLNLNGTIQFAMDQPALVTFDHSTVRIDDARWVLDPESALSIHDDHTEIHWLAFVQGEQRLDLQGKVSASPKDQLVVRFNKFDLSTLNPFIGGRGIVLAGAMDGDLYVYSAARSPFGAAGLTGQAVKFGTTTIGDLFLNADYDPVSQVVSLHAEAIYQGAQTMYASGTYNTLAETDKLDVNLALNNSELAVFQPFLTNLVSEISGTISSKLRISGSFSDLQLNGTSELHDAQFVVDYLRTRYRINDQVQIANSTIRMENMVVRDPRNQTATVNGTVNMANPLVPVIDIGIDAQNFLVLNTTYRDNPLYYGTAYGTGRFEFSGPTQAIRIDIKARTDASTSIVIPLNATSTISDAEFITFVGKDSTDMVATRSPFLRGMTMNMELQVLPDAETSIHTDLGELSGRGEGTVFLGISSLGDFSMFGDYVINNGRFTFTAQDFINKIFEINQGGTIRWTGQPTEATINLTAIYAQRTSVAPLYNAAGGNANEQRVLAQAEMNLNGNLMRPDITFGINFPNEPYIKDELQSYLSDVNNVNQQALSLIVRRSFAPGSSSDFSRELNNTLISAGTELAFNQLNNILAQSLNLRFVDFNIRSLNDASASLRLFNDRVIFTGGVSDRRNLQLHDLNVFGDRIATDAELLYLIRKDGRLVLRGSNRLNTRSFLLNPNNDEYVSAVGLVYRQEFNSFGEFFRRMTTWRSERTDKEATSSEPDSSM